MRSSLPPKNTEKALPTNHSATTIPLKPVGFSVSKLNRELDALENAIWISTQHPLSKQTCIVKIRSTDNNSPYQLTYPVKFSNEIPLEKVGISGPIRLAMGYMLNQNLELDISSIENTNLSPIALISLEIQAIKPSRKEKIHLKADVIKKIFLSLFKDYPISEGQVLLFSYEDYTLEIKVQNIKANQQELPTASPLPLLYQLIAETEMEFSLSPKVTNGSLSGTNSLPKAFSLDFQTKGIGGNKKEIEQIIRNAFLPRALPDDALEKYGEKNPTKGVLLYGPPGTGKTLIAKVISGFFTNDKIKLVRGPELKNKYVGQSQENLRNIFAAAEEEWKKEGKNSQLHAIIFDEIDALFPQRGTRSGANVEDDMVAQMLTLMDGIDSPKNFIVIGTTNRRDLLDPALLRPGRLSVQIEIGLPDESAREEILRIHAKELIENDMLEPDVSFADLAKKTKNYTGAELEELIKRARQYAIANNFDLTPETTKVTLKEEISKNKQYAKVSASHLNRAYSEIKPTFGTDPRFNKFKEENFVVYDKKIEKIIADYHQALSAVKQNDRINNLQMLICGEGGTGKTHLAMYLALQSGANYIKVLSPDMLLGLTIDKKLNIIQEEFENIQRTGGALILDNLEALVNADAELQSYSNDLRLKYESMLKNSFEADKKYIIIATAANRTFIQRLKLAALFNEHAEVSSLRLELRSEETFKVLKQLGETLGYPVIPSHLNENDHDQREINLPIRDLLYQINKFCSSENNKTLTIDDFYQFVCPQRIKSEKTKTSAIGIFSLGNKPTSEPASPQQLFHQPGI